MSLELYTYFIFYIERVGYNKMLNNLCYLIKWYQQNPNDFKRNEYMNRTLYYNSSLHQVLHLTIYDCIFIFDTEKEGYNKMFNNFRCLIKWENPKWF